MSGEQKEPKELRDAFAEANDRLRETFAPVVKLIEEMETRTFRMDASHLSDEQRVFEVDGGPGLTHAVLRGHPLAFAAFREQVIGEVLAALRGMSREEYHGPVSYGDWSWLERELKEAHDEQS